MSLKKLKQAVENWQSKRNEYELELSITASPEKKFNLKQNIQECKEEIERIKDEIRSIEDIKIEVERSEHEENLDLSSPFVQASARFDLFLWSEVVRKNLKDSDFLQENRWPDEVIFKRLAQFLSTSLEAGLTIEIYDNYRKIYHKILDDTDFLAILIASSAVNSSNKGYLKWLIKQTVKSIKSNEHKKLTPNSILDKTWKYICETYCNSLSRNHQKSVIYKILDSVIDCAEEKKTDSSDFLYLFVTFFYNVMGEDTISIRQVADYLDEYDKKLGNDAAPKYLQVLKRLVGTGINTSIYGVNQIPSFSPALVRVHNPSICNYEFDAMAYTLTVFDYATIRGMPPKNVGGNPKEPHIFKIVSENEATLFNLLAAEVLAIIRLCKDSEQNENFIWDVPTVCEWLALADCVDKPYPWGFEEPTKILANIHFSYMPSKLHPVGAYPLGKSTFGAYDCCGNVHEIVRISESSNFPEDFRLAGGCYMTPVQASSCQIIRRFRAQKEDNRRNVGLRLIRYQLTDEWKRYLALQKFPKNTRNVRNIWKDSHS